MDHRHLGHQHHRLHRFGLEHRCNLERLEHQFDLESQWHLGHPLHPLDLVVRKRTFGQQGYQLDLEHQQNLENRWHLVDP